MCRNENIKRPSPKNKYINPPYQIDSRLLHKPCFHTTHLKEYAILNQYKYANIKSKYKHQ
jgi:hypothetical protein